MSPIRIELEVPDELWGELTRIAQEIGLRPPERAAVMAIADWIARRRDELDARDPGRKYFVNEALDELVSKGNKPAEP